MARQEVIQVRCDRCKRVELQASSGVAKAQPDLDCRFGDKRLVYDDLCSHCRETIQRLITDMEEWERELKQTMLGPAVPNNQAAPISSAPDYTPPKPHSAAAMKK
jgi:hypothetical protein